MISDSFDARHSICWRSGANNDDFNREMCMVRRKLLMLLRQIEFQVRTQFFVERFFARAG